MRYAKTAKGSGKLLLAMAAAGLKITPSNVSELGWGLFFSEDAVDIPDEFKAALSQLHQEVLAIAPPQPVAKVKQPSAEWSAAATNPRSEAASGSLHDRIRTPHRPSGKVMPRPRWSEDEKPLGGWDNGTVRVRERKVSKPKQRKPEQPAPGPIMPPLDPKIAAIMAAMMKPTKKTKVKRRIVRY
jgi:hypothetical protein